MCICIVLGNITFKVFEKFRIMANCTRNELNKHICIENRGGKSD